ncbi:hypothetical protein GCM10027300_29110 [Modestobacter lapidis]|nr:hypothetical protein [Modestobacter lapidis]
MTAYGRAALEELLDAVREARNGDSMAPVTVLVPNIVGTAARRVLAHGVEDGHPNGAMTPADDSSSPWAGTRCTSAMSTDAGAVTGAHCPSTLVPALVVGRSFVRLTPFRHGLSQSTSTDVMVSSFSDMSRTVALAVAPSLTAATPHSIRWAI